MLGPRATDEYLLPTERRVIRVRLHWASLTRVFLETAGFVFSTIGLTYVIEDGPNLDSVARSVMIPLIAVGLLSVLSVLSVLSAALLKWLGGLGPARRFGESLQGSLARRAQIALITPIAVLGAAFALQSLEITQGVGVIQTLLWYGALAATLRFGYHLLEWWIERVVVTDKRFMLTTGILETKISLMPIGKVTDMSYTRPIIGRLLGYGTLRVESAGQKQDLERIAFLPRPEEIYNAISELIFGEKGEGRKPSLAPPKSRMRRR